MRRFRSFSALALSTFALPILTFQAQQQNPYSFSTQTNLVIVPTQVTNQQGEFLYGLQASQFVVTDNGVPQHARLEEAPEQTGLSLVVAVQCSRAAALESPKLAGLYTMIEDITGAAPHEVAVLTYGAKSSLLTDFTPIPQSSVLPYRPSNRATRVAPPRSMPSNTPPTCSKTARATTGAPSCSSAKRATTAAAQHRKRSSQN